MRLLFLFAMHYILMLKNVWQRRSSRANTTKSHVPKERVMHFILIVKNV